MRPLFRTTLPSLSARLALFVLPLISSAGTAADGVARILSVYHGLEEVTARAMRWCNRSAVEPQDGMPLVFSVQIDADSVSPSAFAVLTSEGTRVTPLCATLRPALESLEQRTVLLVGEFSPGDAAPARVEVVGSLKDKQGNALTGLYSDKITALAEGPSLVFAEALSPASAGLSGECPARTEQAIQLTWEGGVTGPMGTRLGEAQRTSVTILLENGRTVYPLSLGDDDPDNHVIVCLTQRSPAVSVSIEAGYFHDPGDDPNPATTVLVTANH